MNVFVVEDNIFHLEDAKILLEEMKYQCVGHSETPGKAIEQIGLLPVDIVLIDIHLQGKQSGIELARSIKSLYQLPIIFTTCDRSTDVISQATDMNPVSYLTKPLKKGDLQAALILSQKQKLISEPNDIDRKDNSIYIKSGNKLVRVDLNEILFFHTDSKNYCSIVTSSNQKLTCRSSINSFQELLSSDSFMQTHRSYVVNLDKVDFLNEFNQTINIQKHDVPVGRTYRKALYQRLKIV